MQEFQDQTLDHQEPPFSEEEKEILNLYDQVQNLELEVALTTARVRLAGGLPTCLT